MKKALFFLVLICQSLAGIAQQQCPGFRANIWGYSAWDSTQTGAAQALIAKLPKTSSWSDCQTSVSYAFESITGNTLKLTQTKVACTNSVGVIGGGGTATVNAYIEPWNDTCPDSGCVTKAGQSTVINWTLGYTRTPNIDADASWKLVGPPNKLPSGGSFCDPGSLCTVVQGPLDDPRWMSYQSRSPTSQGLYRLSLDVPVTISSTQCTPSSSEIAGAMPDAPKPNCPGAVGEVNGVLGCYGTAASPTSSDVPEVKPKQPIPGNPKAGEMPKTGEGSGGGSEGRTPSTGDGGPAGGPAAAVGPATPAPDGTTPKPDDGKEQQACGAPGQPACKIDEGGTPGNWDANKWDGQISNYRQRADQARDQIKSSGDSVFSGFNAFFSAPPLAACQPFTLPDDRGEITRHCDVVEGVRSVMAYIWALAALYLCLGWIKRAT